MAALYKYRAYSARSLDMLIRREVYFASPDQLNDPYDCRLNIQDALASAVARANSNDTLAQHLERFVKLGSLYSKIQSEIKDAGVLSLSKSVTSVVMWSHYADEHRGFAVGFELSEKFITHKNDEQIVGAADAYYCENNPFSAFFEEFAPQAKKSDFGDLWMSLLELGLRAKGISWKYEEEVRVIRKKPGVVKVSPDELRYIVFGLDMQTPERETIKAILSGPEWKHVQFQQVRRTDGFAIKVAAMMDDT